MWNRYTNTNKVGNVDFLSFDERLDLFLLDRVLTHYRDMVVIIVLDHQSIFDLAMLHNHVQSMEIGQDGRLFRLVVEHVEVAQVHVWLVSRSNG